MTCNSPQNDSFILIDSISMFESKNEMLFGLKIALKQNFNLIVSRVNKVFKI